MVVGIGDAAVTAGSTGGIAAAVVTAPGSRRGSGLWAAAALLTARRRSLFAPEGGDRADRGTSLRRANSPCETLNDVLAHVRVRLEQLSSTRWDVEGREARGGRKADRGCRHQ